jgi:hypothetical protein
VRTDNARVTTKATREHLEGEKTASSTEKTAKQSKTRTRSREQQCKTVRETERK